MRSNPSLHRASMTASVPVSNSHPSSTIAPSTCSRLTVINARAQYLSVGPRHYFARTALLSAVASVLVGFGMAAASAAESAPRNEVAQSSATNMQNQIQNNSQSYSQNDLSQDGLEEPLLDFDSEAELDATLEALRLRRDFEQGEIDKSVLDEFSEQRGEDSDTNANANANANEVNTNKAAENNSNDNEADVSQANNDRFDSDAELQRQATAIQQQGYQMMTPDQIDRELAALDADNDSFINSFNDSDTLDDGFEQSFDNDLNNFDNAADNNANPNFLSNEGFNAPIARLDSQQLPLGLDPKIDSATLPAPNNLETLNRAQSSEEQAQTAEIMARPIDVSDSVSSGRVDDSADITEQNNPEQILAQQDDRSVTGADDTIAQAQIEASDGEVTATQNGDQSGDLNPDDYLPDYQAQDDTDAVAEGVTQANKSKPLARNEGGIVKRLYNRLFNGGVAALPRVETTVYLQQEIENSTTNAAPRLIKADEDIQPINNIKAAIDDTTVQSVTDFTAALPRLRETALDAAKAVGYYDITLKLRQPDANSIDVIIEKLGEPVTVDSRIVDIRGEGSEQAEFQTLEETALPKEGDVFNHRVYKNSKAALEALSRTYGYFDQYWLNKSVDIILPDNTADISLVYDTGMRYDFDDVVFFTYDEATGTLTRDPDKLPVELPLLRQLLHFEPGDPFYRPDVTKLSNDLAATRYFNTVNVESLLPPDELSAGSTLAFDNVSNQSGNAEDSELDGDVRDGEGVSAGDTDLSSESRDNRANNTDSNEVVAESIDANSGATVDAADIAPIEFQVDEQTQNKLQEIKAKANRLSSLPNDRVLDEKDEKAENFLGKISDSISNIAEKIFPEEETMIDEDFVPPTLANRITPEEVFNSKKIPLYVFVSANKPRDAQVGLGYGTDTDIRATAKIDYNLVNRKGYQAGAEVEASRISKNVTVYGSRPWKHPLNDKLDARLTYEEEVIDQGEGNFDLSTNTVKAALARNIRKESGWNRSYSVRYRLDELETGVDDTELEDLPVRFTSSRPTQQALLFGYGINKTDVNNAINPTSGYRQYYGIEAGSESVLSDTDLAIVRAGVSGIYSFGEDNKHQVLGSFNTGYIWADDFYEVPYKLRFFAGGDQSIRGYDYESLSPLENGYLTGGQVLAVGSAEYNYEFRPGFRGALFTDVGNAYDKDFKTDTKVGVGVGIRWASPVGVVRVDVAAGVTEDSIPVRLHFFIGSPL